MLLICTVNQTSAAYSVLTHEQIVDLLWTDQIAPLLLQKYPGTSIEELRIAHAYAYGGCLIQYMGYYHFGILFFCGLLHYFSCGIFVTVLFCYYVILLYLHFGLCSQ